MNQIENIKEKINQIILENMPGISVKELSDNVELFSLGLNSLNAVSLVLGLEEIFGFEFDMNEINHESFRTISDIVRLIQNKLGVSV